MKIYREFTFEDIVKIIAKQTGLDEQELWSDIDLDSYIDGFRIALDYLRPEIEDFQFNDIWKKFFKKF